MIVIPKNKQGEARSVLTKAGFQAQHSRIFQMLVREDNWQFHCTIGLEDAADDSFQVNISVMQRPMPSGKKGIRLEDIRVIPVDEAPQVLQDRLATVEEQLEQLEQL